MEKLNKKILNLLQQDARYSVEKIALLLGVDEDSVKKAILNMEKEGVIVKYAAIVNSEKVSEDYVDALIEVKVQPQPRSGYDAIAEQIIAFEEVKDVYLVSGTYDMMVILEAKSMRDISLFVSDRLSVIDGITGAATHFILKKYKESGVNIQENTETKRMILHE